MSDNLPVEWKRMPIAELAEIVSGGTPSRDVAEYWEPLEISWVTPTDITNNPGRILLDSREKISLLGLRNSAAKLVPEGTLLMTSRATLGEVKVAGLECCTNQGFKSLVIKEPHNKWFIFYQLQQNKQRYTALGIGSTFLEVSKKDTEKFLLDIAPVKEQKKIADILTTVDNLIEQTEAAIHKYQAIKQGMMQDLFSRGIDIATGQLRPSRQEAPELYQETKLGWVPKEWNIYRLEELLHAPIRDFGSFSSTTLIKFLDEGIPFIKSEMIEEGRINWKTVSYISLEVHEQLAKSYVFGGTILLSKIGSALGKAAVYEGDHGICNSNAAVAKIEINPHLARTNFIEYFLNFDVAQNQLRNVIISLLPRINLGDLDKLKVFVPSLLEQKCIETKLDVIGDLLDSERQKFQKYVELKLGLMQDLLTGRVRVKLDDTDVKDE